MWNEASFNFRDFSVLLHVSTSFFLVFFFCTEYVCITLCLSIHEMMHISFAIFLKLLWKTVLWRFICRSFEDLCFYLKTTTTESFSVMSDSLWLHRLYSPWNFLGRNTGVGSLSLCQGIFPTEVSNPGLPHCRWFLYQLNHKGSPCFFCPW